MVPQATSLLPDAKPVIQYSPYCTLLSATSIFDHLCEDRKKKVAGQKFLIPRVSLRFVFRLPWEVASVDLLVAC